MKDHSLTNSDGASGNRKVEFDSSSEVVAEVSAPGKRRSKAEVASEDNRGRLREELHDRKVEQLRQMFDRNKGTRQLILLQDFPDPDALASAWTYKLIAQQHDIQCDIVYAGTLSHQENIALVRLTNLPAKRWGVQTLKDRDLSVYQGCVLID